MQNGRKADQRRGPKVESYHVTVNGEEYARLAQSWLKINGDTESTVRFTWGDVYLTAVALLSALKGDVIPKPNRESVQEIVALLLNEIAGSNEEIAMTMGLALMTEPEVQKQSRMRVNFEPLARQDPKDAQG